MYYVFYLKIFISAQSIFVVSHPQPNSGSVTENSYILLSFLIS